MFLLGLHLLKVVEEVVDAKTYAGYVLLHIWLRSRGDGLKSQGNTMSGTVVQK